MSGAKSDGAAGSHRRNSSQELVTDTTVTAKAPVDVFPFNDCDILDVWMSAGLASHKTANTCSSFARGQSGTAPYYTASTTHFPPDYLLFSLSVQA